MRFLWCTINVRDMEDSLEFYHEKLGLEIDRQFHTESGMEIVFLGNGETKVELICSKSSDIKEIGRDISLGFEVDSLEDMIKSIEEKGLKIHSGPFQPNPHIRFFYVLDPNGLKIQFVQNL